MAMTGNEPISAADLKVACDAMKGFVESEVQGAFLAATSGKYVQGKGEDGWEITDDELSGSEIVPLSITSSSGLTYDQGAGNIVIPTDCILKVSGNFSYRWRASSGSRGTGVTEIYLAVNSDSDRSHRIIRKSDSLSLSYSGTGTFNTKFNLNQGDTCKVVAAYSDNRPGVIGSAYSFSLDSFLAITVAQ